jgi:hypothetical protein
MSVRLMAALLCSVRVSARSRWRTERRLPQIEMGSQFAFAQDQPDRPLAEGMVGFGFERLKGAFDGLF